MNTLRSVSDLSGLGPAYLAIGVFDGVHLGHQAVIQRALEDSRREPDGMAVVVTFNPHPLRVVRPDVAPRLLTSTRHQAQILAALGVQQLLVMHFDAQFAATQPKTSSGHWQRRRSPCGRFAWVMGGRLDAERSGNLDLLTRLGEQLGFAVVGLPPVTVDGQVASSTLIRTAIEHGDLQAAAAVPGPGVYQFGNGQRRPATRPTVGLSHGEPCRRTMNNSPPNGVYAAEALWRGGTYPGVVNLGFRPTVAQPGGERLLELHLFDFDQQIYGDDVEVRFRAFLRPEKKFAGLAELPRADRARCAASAGAAGCFVTKASVFWRRFSFHAVATALRCRVCSGCSRLTPLRRSEKTRQRSAVATAWKLDCSTLPPRAPSVAATRACG